MNTFRAFLLVVAFFLVGPRGHSQHLPRKKIVSITASVEVETFIRTLPVKLVSTLETGKKRKTGSNNPFDISWNKFKVHLSHGTFEKGLITLPADFLTKGIHEVEIRIQPLNHPEYEYLQVVSIPHISHIVIYQKTNQNYFPGELVPLDLHCYLSNGNVIDWTQLPEEYKNQVFIQQEGKLFPAFDWKMPSCSSFNPVVSIKPVFGQDTSIGNVLKVAYETRKEIGLQKNGVPGRAGRSGRSAYSSTSRNGRDGVDGESGENGENGGHAPDLKIFLETLQVDSIKYVKTIVAEVYSGKREEYLTEEPYFLLKVDCNGGNGGDGGKGGNASDGKNGSDPNSSGTGGNGGHGGYGGHGGDGGKVEVFVSEPNRSLADRVWIKNQGGASGKSGQGGRKGRGGNAEKETATSALFYLLGSRGGLSGQEAPAASTGRDGGIAKLILLKE